MKTNGENCFFFQLVIWTNSLLKVIGQEIAFSVESNSFQHLCDIYENARQINACVCNKVRYLGTKRKVLLREMLH